MKAVSEVDLSPVTGCRNELAEVIGCRAGVERKQRPEGKSVSRSASRVWHEAGSETERVDWRQ